MLRLVALLAALLLTLPAAVSAQTVTRGLTLAATPFPAGQGNDCDAAKRIRSLGTAKFALERGRARKVKVVVDLGTTETTTKNMTLKRGRTR